MHIYKKIYEFAASAGAFEGYVYQKEKQDLDLNALANWAENLVRAYEQLPPDVRSECQSGLDQTIGRAVRSLAGNWGLDHDLTQKLKSIVVGNLPASANAFKKEKWFDLNR
jgi:hypothetical protein